jgi:hypothetical protein
MNQMEVVALSDARVAAKTDAPPEFSSERLSPRAALVSPSFAGGRAGHAKEWNVPAASERGAADESAKLSRTGCARLIDPTGSDNA